jgi:hypothetical protein
MAGQLAAASQKITSSNLVEQVARPRSALRREDPVGSTPRDVKMPPRGLHFHPGLPQETQISPAHPAGFAFYLLVFSPTASLEFPSQPPFRAIIKL